MLLIRMVSACISSRQRLAPRPRSSFYHTSWLNRGTLLISSSVARRRLTLSTGDISAKPRVLSEAARMCLADRVQQHMTERELLCNGQLLIVSVSGGADSVALLRVLLALQERWRLTLHVLHFNHGLRNEAAEEEAFVRSLSMTHGLPFHVRRLPKGWEQSGSGGIQERSREWRRAESIALLSELNAEAGAEPSTSAVALGHHADDAVETLILKCLRGCHISNLQSMQWRHQGFLRPLLATSKAELVSHLRSIGQPWMEDSSNAEPKYKRNRVRLQLLPLLDDLAAGGLAARLEAAEYQSTQLRHFLNSATQAYGTVDEAWQREPPRVSLSKMRTQPQIVQDELLYALVSRGTSQQETLSHQMLRRIQVQLARGRVEWEIALSGSWAFKRIGDSLFVAQPQHRRPCRSSSRESELDDEQIHAKQRLQLGTFSLTYPAKWKVHAGECQVADVPSGAVALFNLFEGSHICLRTFRPGDRFHPAWRSSAIGLKDFLRGQHIPLEERRCLPLVALQGPSPRVVAVYRPPKHYVARDHQTPSDADRALWLLVWDASGHSE